MGHDSHVALGSGPDGGAVPEAYREQSREDLRQASEELQRQLDAALATSAKLREMVAEVEAPRVESDSFTPPQASPGSEHQDVVAALL